MSKIALTNPTDLDLSIAVHQWVANVPPDVPNEADNKEWGLYWAHKVPPYATSADAVLPLLNSTFWIWSYHPKDQKLYADDDPHYRRLKEGDGPFPRAACIALLRANGVTVDGR